MKVFILLMEEEAIPLEVEEEVEVEAIKVQFNVTIVQNMESKPSSQCPGKRTSVAFLFRVWEQTFASSTTKKCKSALSQIETRCGKRAVYAMDEGKAHGD